MTVDEETLAIGMMDLPVRATMRDTGIAAAETETIVAAEEMEMNARRQRIAPVETKTAMIQHADVVVMKIAVAMSGLMITDGTAKMTIENAAVTSDVTKARSADVSRTERVTAHEKIAMPLPRYPEKENVARSTVGVRNPDERAMQGAELRTKVDPLSRMIIKEAGRRSRSAL